MPAASSMSDGDSKPSYTSVSAQPRASTPMEAPHSGTSGSVSTDNRTPAQARGTSNDKANIDESGSTRQPGRSMPQDRTGNTLTSQGRDKERDSRPSRNADEKTSRSHQRRDTATDSSQAPGSLHSPHPLHPYARPPASAGDAGSRDRDRTRAQEDSIQKPTTPATSTEEEDVVMVYYNNEEEQNAPEGNQNAALLQISRIAQGTNTELNSAAAAAASGGAQQVPTQPGIVPRDGRSSTKSSSASAQAAAQPLPPRSPLSESPPGTEHGQRGGYGGGPDIREASFQPQASSGGGYFSKIPFMGPPRDRAKEAFDKLSVDYQNAQGELRNYAMEINRLKKNCYELSVERQKYREEVIALKNELKNVRRELDDSRQLSEVRGKELLGAQVFLTKADLLSVSELAEKVNHLNDENFQAAAFLGEFLVHSESQWKSDAEKDASYRSAHRIIGEPMLSTLVANANDPAPNPLLVQLVLQICLAWFCRAKIDLWHEGDAANAFLTRVYNEIRLTEEQAVSGRWRAITHAKTRLATDSWCHEFTSNLHHVLALACWTVDPPDAKSSFELKLKPIFKAILDLRIALGEKFTSSDIEPFAVEPETPFEKRYMEDALDDGRSSSRKQDPNDAASGTVDTVVATSGIGLKQWVPRGTRRGSGEHRITLSPKVILRSSLTELLQPPPPRKSRSSRPAK